MKFLRLKLPPIVVFIISLGLFRSIIFFSSDFILFVPHRFFFSLFVLCSGLVVGLLGIIEFRRRKTSIDPTQPEKAVVIVASGIYRFTRNPMYLGLVLILLAGVVYAGNPFTLFAALFLSWYLTYFQIKPEEEILKQKFGKPYQEYKRKVRRWI